MKPVYSVFITVLPVQYSSWWISSILSLDGPHSTAGSDHQTATLIFTAEPYCVCRNCHFSFVLSFTFRRKFHILVVAYSLKIASNIVKPFDFND